MHTIDVDAYRRDGFVHLRGIFDREELDEIRRDARRVFELQISRVQCAGTHSHTWEGEAPAEPPIGTIFELSGSAGASPSLARTGSRIETSSIQLPHTEQQFEQKLFDYFQNDLTGFTNCGKQIQHLISLHRLSLDARILSTLTQLGLEFPNISTRPVLFFNSRQLAKREVYWRVFAHQDWRSMQGSLNAVVVWVPLGDIGRDLGALEVVPGSHRLGLVTSEVVERFGKVDRFADEDFKPIEVEQGDALFFSAFLVHRSGTNSTESIRWSCHFRYNDLAGRPSSTAAIRTRICTSRLTNF